MDSSYYNTQKAKNITQIVKTFCKSDPIQGRITHTQTYLCTRSLQACRFHPQNANNRVEF